MSTITAQTHLAANLASLGLRNAEMGEKLATIASAHGRLECVDTPQGPSAILDGKPLSSRQRPLDEAERLVKDIDLVEHAVVVVLGFGSGYHVQKIAERAGQAALSGALGA